MNDLDSIKKKISEHKDYLKDKYGAVEIGIFGSYVKSRQKKGESDIDILVDFEDGITLLKFIEMENYLSDQLGIKVDLVMKRALKPRIGKQILKEVIYV
ncbi:MAG: nucleotidyltransferase family protein [Thermoplasmata archaeon]|nr:MAG: nucleotidyltransferase family protein [Thermoplasmata archaeon]